MILDILIVSFLLTYLLTLLRRTIPSNATWHSISG